MTNVTALNQNFGLGVGSTDACRLNIVPWQFKGNLNICSFHFFFCFIRDAMLIIFLLYDKRDCFESKFWLRRGDPLMHPD